MRRLTIHFIVFIFAELIGLTSPLSAAIVATGFFSGTIERFDPDTGQQTTLANIAAETGDPFPGLSGIAYDSVDRILYAAGRVTNRIYRVDAFTGTFLGSQQLADGSQPVGIALDGNRNLYVANNGGNSVSVFNSAGDLIDSIVLPDVGVGDNLPSGIAFDDQGRLLISTFAGGGLFRYDPGTDAVTQLAANPLANNQIAVDAAGDILVGGAAFSNDVLKFTEGGSPIDPPFLTIDESLLPQPPEDYASPDFTSPGGVVIDPDGNLIVAALGRTNPTSEADNFQNNGGLWKFSPDGTLLQTYGTGLTPLSSVTFVPEPNSLLILSALSVLWLGRRPRRSKLSAS